MSQVRVKLRFVLLLASFGCTEGAQSVPDQAGAVIALSPAHDDFGTVTEGSVTRQFQLQNCTPEPVQLKKAITGCDCNKVEYSDAMLAPGEVAVVVVVFQGKADYREFVLRIVVPWAGDRLKGSVELSSAGRFRPLLTFSPARINLSRLPPSTAECIVSVVEGESIEPVSVHLTKGLAECRLQPAGSGKWKLLLTRKGDSKKLNRLPPLIDDGDTLVVYTSSTVRPVYKIPVRIVSDGLD